MASTSTKIGHGLAKVLGIKLDQHNPPEDALTRGESAYSVSTAETYVEDEPHTTDYLRELIPSGHDVVNYFVDLFPFTKWILKYNVQWLIGDLIAGITIGAVVVPQGMAYAKLAQLPVEFGLYTSFMGVLIYWFFATSKDITIGPVAVMSTIVGNVILKVHKTHPKVPGYEIASALAIIAGAIICFLGLARLGWVVEFIPLTAISAFMTGSAINICAGQVPTMLGINSRFNTRAATYHVIINSFKNLPHTTIDAAPGLTALFLLYLIRYLCNTFAKRFPSRAKLFFFISTLRTVFVILLYTLVSWLVNRHHRKKPIFALLGNVPRGFQHAGVPVVNTTIIRYFASELPASVIVLLIEHIAIAKSFGRVNNYTINPSQEMVAIGISNLLGPFLGAYPATGSFSRTAIKAKAGVRTPFAGVITAVVVLLAIYALPAVFFYIPNAPLAAVIIHAVGDLITPPNTVYQFYRVSPPEVVVFFAGVIVTIFTTIEIGIYVTICTSIAILLFRYALAQGNFVGKVKIHSVIGDHLMEDKFHDNARDIKQNLYDDDVAIRNVFLPFGHHDGSNPNVQIDDPYPGVFIYRFSEGFNYPNAHHYLDYLVETIFKKTRRTNANSYPRLGDRPWNDPGPRRGQVEASKDHLPTLKAVILDFSSVNNVDVTSVQNLIDIRNQLERYAAPEPVQWHFAGIKNRWSKRALAAGGFGYPTQTSASNYRLKSIFSVAEIGGSSSAAAQAEREERKQSEYVYSNDIEAGELKGEHAISTAAKQLSQTSSSDNLDLQKQISSSKAYERKSKGIVVVQGLNRPFFHLDLTSALQTAITNIEEQHKRGVGTELA